MSWASGAQLLEGLDQDGPPQMTTNRRSTSCTCPPPRRRGWSDQGQLDAATFEVLSRAVRGLLCPAADEGKTLGERQADALGEICEHALDEVGFPRGWGTPACDGDPGLPVDA